MITSSRYASAVRFAIDAHAGQVRKGTAIPYITHPLAVSGLVMEFAGDEDQAVAGLLHDVVEDCGVAIEDLDHRYGRRVADIVAACTDGVPDEHGRKPPWLERKTDYLRRLANESLDTVLVSACDKLHNARAIVSDAQLIGPHVFDRFSAEARKVIWYYRSVAEIIAHRLPLTRLCRTLKLEVEAMESLVVP